MTVIWDWNGTLLNDVNLSCELLNRLLKNNGYKEYGGINEYKKVFGFPIKTYYQNAGFNFETHSFEDLAQQYMDMFKQDHLSCELHENSQNVLSALQKKSVRQVILSASPVDMLLMQTEHWNVKQYFDKILGLSDIYAKGKVDIAKQWLVSEKPNLENAIMVGDTVHDAEVAKTLGVKCVLFSGGHQNYERLNKTGAAIIDDLKQVLDFIP